MEFITNIIDYFLNHFDQILQIVGAAAAIATLTPNKADNKIVQFVLDLVNFLGANLGKSKNDPNV